MPRRKVEQTHVAVKRSSLAKMRQRKLSDNVFREISVMVSLSHKKHAGNGPALEKHESPWRDKYPMVLLEPSFSVAPAVVSCEISVSPLRKTNAEIDQR